MGAPGSSFRSVPLVDVEINPGCTWFIVDMWILLNRLPVAVGLAVERPQLLYGVGKVSWEFPKIYEDLTAHLRSKVGGYARGLR